MRSYSNCLISLDVWNEATRAVGVRSEAVRGVAFPSWPVKSRACGVSLAPSSPSLSCRRSQVDCLRRRSSTSVPFVCPAPPRRGRGQGRCGGLPGLDGGQGREVRSQESAGGVEQTGAGHDCGERSLSGAQLAARPVRSSNYKPPDPDHPPPSNPPPQYFTLPHFLRDPSVHEHLFLGVAALTAHTMELPEQEAADGDADADPVVIEELDAADDGDEWDEEDT